MFEALNGYLSGVNNSKLVMAMLMLTLNIGSKYVDFGFSKAQEQLLRNSVTREFIIFAISFTATRDILISIIITSAFFIMSNILFHEESKHCIIPKRMKQIKALVDTNNDGVVTDTEVNEAIAILEKARKNKQGFPGRRYLPLTTSA